MTFETVFTHGPGQYDAYFESVDDASDIAAAFKAGKNVIMYLPVSEDSQGYGWLCDVYVRMISYQPEFESSFGQINCEGFGFSYDCLSIGDPEEDVGNNRTPLFKSFINQVNVASNGKLKFKVYVD